jgi:beta propeller repeat protein
MNHNHATWHSKSIGRLWLLAAAVVLLASIHPGAVAGDGRPLDVADLDEFVVCDDPARQWIPSAAGGLVVWIDDRNADGDVYGYDLAGQTEVVISDAAGDQSIAHTDGSTVVWYDSRNATTAPDIYGYDLTSQTEFTICTESHSQLNPKVSGHYVVWQDSRAGSSDQNIYGYDLDADTEFLICNAEESQVGPAIHGDIVVWMDYRNEFFPPGCWPDCNTDIYGYDLSTGTEFVICDEEHFQGYPAVYGDTVVWVDGRNGNYDLYGYDLATHQEFTICLEPHDQISASINENWIVWSDKRNEADPAGCGANCNYDLYGLRRGTGTELALVVHPAQQFQQALDGNLLYWSDKRNEADPEGCGSACNYDIYGAALVPGEAGFAGGRTEGILQDEPIVVEFALPMDTSSVTYACTPDPGGWVESWDGTRRAANGTILTLAHDPFALSTTYTFTVTEGVDVLGRAIEPFGLVFTSSGPRVYLPLVVRN